MVRTYKNPQGGSLGGFFDSSGYQSSVRRSRQTKEDVKSGGLSSSSEEFSSPIPNQQNFSPPFHNGSRRQYSNSPLSNSGGSRLRAADPMGNIFILPRQLDVGLCQCCRNIYGAKDDHHHHHHGHAIDYDDLLNQKRRAEVQYRNGDPGYVNGFTGMKGSSSEQFLTRAAGEPQEDFGLANGLNDLSSVLSRLQNNGLDPDDSTVLTSVSYPNSAANVPNAQSNGRQAYSAPQDPFGFKGPNSILPKNGPGDGPSYGRAKMQAERNRIRQIAMGGSLMSDPMENVSRRRDSYNQAIEKGGKNGYNPSMYEADSQKRGDSNGKDAYLLELEQQIAETRERKKKEKNGHQDWWEKKNEPRFTVKMPTKPHPSQTADQRPDPRLGQKSLQEELRIQMELKKAREAEEKAREREEEAKLEKRIQEQQERMRKEFEEEQAKKKAKEQAKLKRQEDMARRQQEIQREAERQRKEAAERKFQERKASRLRRQQEEQERLNNDSSRGSTPTPVPPTNRSDSPPIPALRNSQNNSSNSEFESASIGLSSEDDQESAAALNQLSKMREQLNKKQEDLSGQDLDQQGSRKNSIWDGLAE